MKRGKEGKRERGLALELKHVLALELKHVLAPELKHVLALELKHVLALELIMGDDAKGSAAASADREIGSPVRAAGSASGWYNTIGIV